MSNRHFSCLQSWECESSWRIESSWIGSAVRPFWFSFKRWAPLKLVQETPCQFQEMKGMSMQSHKADLLKINSQDSPWRPVQSCKWWPLHFHSHICHISCLPVCAFLSFWDVTLLMYVCEKALIGTMNICQAASSSMAMDFTSSKSCSASSPAPRPWAILSVIYTGCSEFRLIMTDPCPHVSRWFSTKQQALIAALKVIRLTSMFFSSASLINCKAWQRCGTQQQSQQTIESSITPTKSPASCQRSAFWQALMLAL